MLVFSDVFQELLKMDYEISSVFQWDEIKVLEVEVDNNIVYVVNVFEKLLWVDYILRLHF